MKIYKILLVLIIVLASLIRFVSISQNPPSPYWEEAALGFDAYSILKTGKDHHGNFMPLVAFESFGDWKPSLYFYSAVPGIAIFGLNTLAVRLPSVLAGILTVLLSYFIVKQLYLLKNNKQTKLSESMALVSALLMAVVPWHVMVSRVGFECNLGFFLSVLGFYLFLKFINQGKLLFISLSFFTWGLSLYAYHSNRIFIPVLIICLGLLFFKKICKQKISIIIASILLLVMALPIAINLKNPEISKRFAETSAFTSLDPILESNQKIADGGNTLFAKIIHHRFRYWGKIFLDNYFSHFDSNFLFFDGDSNLRHSSGIGGQIYLIMLPFLLLSIYYLFSKKDWWLAPIFIWLLLSPVASGLTKAVPHGLRALPMILSLCILSAYGVSNFLFELKNYSKKIKLVFYVIAIGIGGILLLETVRFQHYYHKFYSQKNSQWWQYGYRQVMQYMGENKDKYDQILVSRDYGRPAIYYWFFNQIDPQLVQAWNEQVPKDQGEFLQFENIYFGIKPEKQNKQLIIEATSSAGLKLLKQINFMDGQPAFYIYEN
jgi:4-amino-4-deoxy-L-arabinose transferase-like glycosyltransferase